MAFSGKFSRQERSSGLDFRSFQDNAWYSVTLELKDDILTVKYLNFTEQENENFNATMFKNADELDDFKERFRPTSIQLQDCECSRVIEGMEICASYVSNENDVRFYDAVVEKVIFSDHKVVEGEDVCTCTFQLFWLYGPAAGVKTYTQIEHVCMLQRGNTEIDPALDAFLKLSRRKLESSSWKSCSSTCSTKTSCKIELDGQPFDSRTQGCHSKDLENPKLHQGLMQAIKGGCAISQRKSGNSTDLGGEARKYSETVCSYYVIFIENLETDLSPFVIANFIHQQTSVSCCAYVSPSLSAELFTRGVVILESQENLKEVSCFLHNPDHLIMSSRGRPWVVETKWRPRAFDATFGFWVPELQENKLQKKGEGLSNEVNVVLKGAKEYEAGKLLRKLFKEFQEHQAGLHKRLALDEKRILQSLKA